MSTSLLSNLTDYLAADTQPWAACAKRLSEELGRWVAERLESTSAVDVARAEFTDPVFISEALLEYLLAPTTVSQVLDKPNLATHLADDIMIFLVTRFVANRESARDYWADNVFEPWTYQSGDSRLGEAVFGQASICDFVDRAAAQSTETPLVAVPDYASIVRLETIDLALYQTLKEHPDLLRTINWRTFEKLLADLLERSGYEVELQRGTKDGGVDVFAIKRTGIFGPERYLLQAKRWQHGVGIDPVRQVVFLHQHHRMTKSCLATTGRFTRGALELAVQYQWQLELLDFEGIKSWVTAVSNKLVV
jgi:Restriction endonuclease